MIHELSHSFYVYAGGVGKPHSKDHARFEIRMVKEVLKRGWLEPKPAAVEVVVDTLKLKREAKLASIDAAIKRWQSKLARAERALKKYEKQRRYYARALGLE
jgi:F0F1-type ATP synthase epsilon subunit